jgi:hypothetical protein
MYRIWSLTSDPNPNTASPASPDTVLTVLNCVKVDQHIMSSAWHMTRDESGSVTSLYARRWWWWPHCQSAPSLFNKDAFIAAAHLYGNAQPGKHTYMHTMCVVALAILTHTNSLPSHTQTTEISGQNAYRYLVIKVSLLL